MASNPSGPPPNPNGSYLQQADPQSFGATGQNYQPTTQQQPQPDVEKDEVGWYFVEQYYTTLNKTPERLHLFYNKKSSFVWGTEGDSLPLAHGRTEIMDKIAGHDFKDCKVRVSNVDSQASQGNGIVIQVLGEMSNNGLPNRKFAQTFFLAEQPNGFYVLNDIFRYLKDDDDIEDADAYEYVEEAIEEAAEEIAEEIVAETAEIIEQVAEDLAEEADVDVKETTKIEIEAEGDKVHIEETHTVEPSAPESENEGLPRPVNGTAQSTNGSVSEAAPEPEAKTEEPAVPETSTPEPEPKAPVAEEKPVASAPPAAPAKETPPTPAPAPAPARPKTWANLVAATPPTPVATQPVTPSAASQAQAPAAPAAAPATPSTPTTPGGGSQWQTADNKRHSRQAIPPGQTLAYIKNIGNVTERGLNEALSKFGILKQCEINKQKNCAFVDFESPASFTAAHNANPHTIEGATINVEERRPRQPANGAYPANRGGAARGDGRNPNQGGRGGYQPRDGGRFEGRGGGRGGRGSGYTPRGGMRTPATPTA